MRKLLLASAASAALALPLTMFAQSAAAEDSPHSLSGNFGLYSQYIFRGVSQTNTDPAIQGGFDYSHASGLYAGTWLSNVSWLTDAAAYSSSSLEWDVYGGYRGTFSNSDFGYDVGLLQYYYPGTVTPGLVKADTLEAYGALSWKWLSAKYSYSLGNKTFGVADSRGTWYLDISANYPLTDKLGLQAHYGKQKFDGTVAGVTNDSFASFEDYKLGLSYALPKDFTVGAYYTTTTMDATQEAFYSNATRFLGKDNFTAYVQKTF
ncbi:MAG: hypothetical protein IH605_18785 [Burkholderiales bacterium]|nr:hypothetical protein [Burkholderiales bacterium]